MEHLFDPEHQFVKLNCSREAAYEKITETVINADLSGKIPADRPFAIRTNINGHEIEVRGMVVDGELRYGTIFIPEK
jgi:hypothetical protein